VQSEMPRGLNAVFVACIILLLGDASAFTSSIQIAVPSGRCIFPSRPQLSLRQKNSPSSPFSIAMNFNEAAEASKTENGSPSAPSGSSAVKISLSSLISEASPEEAARRRAQAAREALRRAQLVGESMPSDWTQGQHFIDGDRNVSFGPGELVVFKQRFAVVQMYDDNGMVVVEAGHGDAPGSRGMRHLGPTILGKITEMGHQSLAQS
jgi:hypothetical protein